MASNNLKKRIIVAASQAHDARNPPKGKAWVTGGFPSKMPIVAKSVSILWHYHERRVIILQSIDYRYIAVIYDTIVHTAQLQ